MSKDPTIWGEQARAEAEIRLGWVDLPRTSRTLLPKLDALWAWARSEKIDHVILSGMGGSSLAPELIAAAFKKNLTIVDSTDPKVMASLAERDLTSAAVLISSKSGSTIETRAHKAFFQDQMRKQGIDPSKRMLVITDPGSPLATEALAEGLQVINADPNVGGRFSALSAFGLVPAALLGIDIAPILDDALDALAEMEEPGNPAEELVTFLSNSRFIRFDDTASPYPGLADWVEQLIAESTGKEGKGLLPIVAAKSSLSLPVIDLGSDVIASLGAHFILWEWVTALLGWKLGVDPFNQPNVQETKARTLEYLKLGAKSDSSDQRSEIDLVNIRESLDEAAPAAEYISIHAYLDRHDDATLLNLRELFESRYQKPVTFGWGPRFLHSTGQYHKGGPKDGLFLSITGESKVDIPIPGESYTFGELIKAQAAGDRSALEAEGLKVFSIHLGNRESDIKKLLQLF